MIRAFFILVYPDMSLLLCSGSFYIDAKLSQLVFYQFDISVELRGFYVAESFTYFSYCAYYLTLVFLEYHTPYSFDKCR